MISNDPGNLSSYNLGRTQNTFQTVPENWKRTSASPSQVSSKSWPVNGFSGNSRKVPEYQFYKPDWKVWNKYSKVIWKISAATFLQLVWNLATSKARLITTAGVGPTPAVPIGSDFVPTLCNVRAALEFLESSEFLGRKLRGNDGSKSRVAQSMLQVSLLHDF